MGDAAARRDLRGDRARRRRHPLDGEGDARRERGRACRGGAPAPRRADRGRRDDHRDQVRLRARCGERGEDAARGDAARRERDVDGASAPSSARMRCRRKRRATRPATSTRSATSSFRWSRRQELADAVDGFCERIAFSPEQMARVFDAARGHGLPGKAPRRAAFQSAAAPSSPPAMARSPPTTSNISTTTGVGALAQAGTVAVLLPGAFYFLKEKQKPPVEALRRAGVPIAVATDCNPGSSPLTSLLLAMNMAATLFGLTVEECLLGVTRNAARALGKLSEIGTLEVAKWCDLADLGRRSGRPSSSIVSASTRFIARCRRGPMSAIVLKPGAVPLADWRRDLSRRGVALDPACRAGVAGGGRSRRRRSSRRASRSTASTPASESSRRVRIDAADLATLQRNIVLSHAAGVGEPIARGDRAADDGAEAREPRAGRLRRAARDARSARGDARRATSSRSCRRRARPARPAISRRSRT